MVDKKQECCPPPKPITEILVNESEKDTVLARFAKALGHPARIKILKLLLERESCVCGEIVKELPFAQSTVSQHLKQLKEAGLIRGEVEGPKVCYCVEPDAVSLFQTLVQEL